MLKGNIGIKLIIDYFRFAKIRLSCLFALSVVLFINNNRHLQKIKNFAEKPGEGEYGLPETNPDFFLTRTMQNSNNAHSLSRCMALVKLYT
jgi:hypothetical protein